jgi:hypothetical protein
MLKVFLWVIELVLVVLLILNLIVPLFRKDLKFFWMFKSDCADETKDKQI